MAIVGELDTPATHDWRHKLGPVHGFAVALVPSLGTPEERAQARALEPFAGLLLAAVGFCVGSLLLWAGMKVVPVAAVLAALAAMASGAERDGAVGRLRGDRDTVTLWLVCAVLLRFGALASIDPDRWFGALAAALVFSRAVPWLLETGQRVLGNEPELFPGPFWRLGFLALAALCVLGLGTWAALVALLLTLTFSASAHFLELRFSKGGLWTSACSVLVELVGFYCFVP